MKTKDNRKITYFFFVFSLGLIFTFIILDVLFNTYNVKQKLMDNGFLKIEEKESFLKNEINIPKNILLSIRNSVLFNDYLKNPTKYNFSLNDIFLILVKQNQNIMQLRYLDKNGMEKIRVDRKRLYTNPTIINKDNLQNKASRYYFKDSKSKLVEKVWLSELDLNMEEGKVETPYKPTLRITLPLGIGNNFEGILIINYYMKDLLRELSSMSLYNMVLINEKGYYLIHYDKKKDWSFYNPKKTTIKSEYPEEFDEILNKETVKSTNFVSKKLDINISKKLILILKIKESFFEQYQEEKTWHYLIVGTIILILSMIMSFMFSKYLKNLFLILKDAKALNRLLNKRVEEKTEELYLKKKQYQDIIQTINDFVWETDKNGTYTYISPQVEEILGYKPNEVLNKTPFDFMPKEEVIKIKPIFENFVKSEKPIIQLRNENISKKGDRIYLETSGNPVYDKKSNLIGYRGTDRDITKKVLADKELILRHKEIEKLNNNLKLEIEKEVQKNHEKDIQIFAQSKMASMGDMIGNIAHQWRQPLSAISMTASGVKINYEFEKLDYNDIPEEMDKIVNHTQYLSKTIQTFMDFFKEEKEFKKVNLSQTIKSAIDIVRSSLSSNYIQIKENLEAVETIEIYTISHELKEVIINIINNAKDAITENDISSGLVILNVEKKKDQIIIKIEDNAGGIPDNIADRIFEPYFTTKHKSQGTGLGLHMAYRVVTESLKGNISVKNSSCGAIFIIELPLKIIESNKNNI